MTTGHDDNAGFFDGALGTAGGANDRAWNNSPVIFDGATITATVHTTTTQINVTGYTVAAGDVGNVFRSIGGTGTAGRYRITAVDTVNNRWTVDAAAGTAGQTLTGRLGGAILSPAIAASLAGSTALRIFVEQGTYNFTSTANVAGGCVSCPSARWYGHATGNRNDRSAGPTFVRASGSSFVMVAQLGDAYIENVTVDQSSGTAVDGFVSYGVYRQCRVVNIGGSSSRGFSDGQAIDCVATGSGTSSGRIGFNNLIAFRCVASNTSASNFTGFAGITGRPVSYCVAILCSVGFNSGAGNSCSMFNCTAVSCTTGFTLGSPTQAIENCLAASCTTGFSTNTLLAMFNCAGYNNTTNVSGSPRINAGFVSLTADPFVNSAGGDYSLNTAVGGGAACRSVGVGTFTGLSSTTSYPDIGAVQALVQGGVKTPRAMNGGFSA